MKTAIKTNLTVTKKMWGTETKRPLDWLYSESTSNEVEADIDILHSAPEWNNNVQTSEYDNKSLIVETHCLEKNISNHNYVAWQRNISVWLAPFIAPVFCLILMTPNWRIRETRYFHTVFIFFLANYLKILFEICTLDGNLSILFMPYHTMWLCGVFNNNNNISLIPKCYYFN